MIARIIFLIFLVVSFAGDRIFKDSIAPQINGWKAGPLEILDDKQPSSGAKFLLVNTFSPDLMKVITTENFILFISLCFAVIILIDFKNLKKLPFKKAWHLGIVNGLFLGVFLSRSYDFLWLNTEINNFKLNLGILSLSLGTATLMLLVLWAYLSIKPSLKMKTEKPMAPNGIIAACVVVIIFCIIQIIQN